MVAGSNPVSPTEEKYILTCGNSLASSSRRSNHATGLGLVGTTWASASTSERTCPSQVRQPLPLGRIVDNGAADQGPKSFDADITRQQRRRGTLRGRDVEGVSVPQ